MCSNIRGTLTLKLKVSQFSFVAFLLTGCSDSGAFVDRISTPEPGQGSDLLSARRIQLAIEPNRAVMAPGEKKQFSAFLVHPDGTSERIDDEISWKVRGYDETARSLADSSGAVSAPATVDSTGTVTAIEAGSLLVEAIFDGESATADVEIRQASTDDGTNPTTPVTPSVQFTSPVAADEAQPILVPHSKDIPVTWMAESVVDCILFDGEAELYRGLDGSTSISVNSNRNLRIECLAVDGTSVQDTLVIHSTMPSVRLSANGTESDIVVFADSTVAIDWTSQHTDSCDVRYGNSVMGSTPTGSGIVSISTGAAVTATCRDSAGNTATASIHISVNHSSRFSLSPGTPDQISGTIAARPVSIIFALDVTGSMAGQIGTVKSGVQEFVSELVRRDFKPKIGVIPFRDKVPRAGNLGDVPEGRLELTEDVETVKSFVSSLRASGGGDANEAALGAIAEAFDALKAQDHRPDAIKIILVVTDHPGHHGSVTTDCQIAPTINKFASLSEADQKNIKLFYAVPTTGSSCSGYSSGLAQMTALREQILTAVADTGQRGGPIPWPFDHSNLVNDVVALLEDVKPPVDLICLNEQVTFTLSDAPDEPVISRSTTDLSEVYARYQSKSPQVIDAVLDEDEHSAFERGDGRANVERCCVSAAAAAIGDFHSCLKRVSVVDESFGFE